MLRADEQQSRLSTHDLRRESASHVTPAWHGKAFLVEAMVILAFLVVSLAILISVFVHARIESAQGAHQTEAIHLAQNAAEQFSADPAGSQGLVLAQDELRATVEVTPEPHEDGTLYRATVSVVDEAGVGRHDQNAETYRLDTARYVPAGESEVG